MSIQKDLKKEGIEVIEKIDDLIATTILKNIARRIVESFPHFELNEKQIMEKFSELTLYKAKMEEGMAEANYYYKNKSIYFNEHIEYDDLEEFAIHECIHYLQEIKDEKGSLTRMGLSSYKSGKPFGLAINEAAVQYTASHIIGIESDYEKYYNITLYTPSPSYYPIECSLLNQIIYFTGEDKLFKSTLFSTDDFKNAIIEMSSKETYQKIQSLFDDILKYEETVIKFNNKISLYEDGDFRIDKLNKKISRLKNKIVLAYFETQNTIIEEFFDYGFEQISNMEELETYRHKLYKFSDIIGAIPDYKFFDNYYALTMNKLEHKCNIFENGGIETALESKHTNKFIEFLKRIFSKNVYLKPNKDI